MMLASQPAVPPAFDLMIARLREAAIALFSAYEIPATIQEAPQPAAPLRLGAPAGIAVMGFAGKGVRGALALVALDSAVETWVAAMGEAACDLADVLGEFANMMLGCLKNRLLDEGLVLEVSTPTTTSGTGLRISMPPGASHWLSLAGASWELSIRLDAYFDSQFQLQPTNGTGAAADAGAVILF